MYAFAFGVLLSNSVNKLSFNFALCKGRKVKKSHQLVQIANHLDHDNPHTFEAADLTNLIRAVSALYRIYFRSLTLFHEQTLVRS